MSINFPTSLDTLANPTAGELLENAVAGLDHDTQHSNANDAIEALEAKVGVTSSAVTTSHDYKLSEVTSTDKAVGKTATQTLTNKTLTSPILNLSSNATGDIYFRKSDGTLDRLAIGTTGNILDVSAGGVPEWVANPSSTDASTSAKGVTKLSVAPASASNPIAVGDNDTRLSIHKNGSTTYDLSTASGTQNIAHGGGRIPNKVKITAVGILMSATGTYWTETVYNGTTQSSLYRFDQTGTATGEDAGASFRLEGDGVSGYYVTGTVTYDATNISIAWVKTNSPTGTAYLTWETE